MMATLVVLRCMQKCPGVIEANPDKDKAEMQQRARNHQEMVN